jgi:hypothetical protein
MSENSRYQQHINCVNLSSRPKFNLTRFCHFVILSFSNFVNTWAGQKYQIAYRVMCQNSWHYYTYTRRRLAMRSEPSRFLETGKVYKRAPSLGKRFHVSEGDKLPHTNSQHLEDGKVVEHVPRGTRIDHNCLRVNFVTNMVRSRNGECSAVELIVVGGQV